MSTPEPTLPTLTRLLSKLSPAVLAPAQKPTQYDRARLSANLEHARTMLLTLEKQSAAIRVVSQRHAAQAELKGQRDIIKRLGGALGAIEGRDEDESDEEEDDEAGGKDAQSWTPARHDANAGLDTGVSQGPQISITQQSELRSRKPPPSISDPNPHPTTASTTARDQLFAARPQTTLQSQESLETHNRTQQAALEAGLLGLVRALKESSLNIGASLETDKEIQARAQGGLEKTSGEMDAAQRSMGMLRRMSEGQGWWGRVKLYAFIFGLWVVCFLLVFLGPKLRF